MLTCIRILMRQIMFAEACISLMMRQNKPRFKIEATRIYEHTCSQAID